MKMITDEDGKEIWDKLVELCGLRRGTYDEQESKSFTAALQHYFAERERLRAKAVWPFEWRFQGALGFGGKFYHQDFDGFTVGCYREDDSPERQAMIDAMNAWLKERFPKAENRR